MKNNNTLIAFLAGAAAGAVTAILLAPDTGRNTFSRIKESASDLLGDLEELAERIQTNRQTLEEVAEDVDEEITATVAGVANELEEDPLEKERSAR